MKLYEQRRKMVAANYIRWLMRERGISEHEARMAADPSYAKRIRELNERRNSPHVERATLHEADRTDSDRKWDRVWRGCPIRHYKRGNCQLPAGHSGRCQYAQFDIENAIANVTETGLSELDNRIGPPDDSIDEEFTCLRGEPCAEPVACENAECWVKPAPK